MSLRVEVNPDLLAWARERSRLGVDDLTRQFPKLREWERGGSSPTLKQLEGFAQATHTPVGFLFLPEPPDEQIPIPDYRTMSAAAVRRPSPDLLDTIYQCQLRQEWYREFAQANREEPVGLVGAFTTAYSVTEAADTIRAALAFDVSQRGSNWTDALKTLIEHAEDLGVLVMVNGVVGNNTHRKLDPNEFRGFALVDPWAPVIFVNGADTKAAQIFTIAHELAHLSIGEDALDNAAPDAASAVEAERWCNAVAAEILLPLAAISTQLRQGAPLMAELERLARQFKVSTLVVLHRMYEAGRLEWDEYRAAYEAERERVLELVGERTSSGGNFFNTQPLRVSRRFARAVIASALEGQTLQRDAFHMLGVKKLSTFQELANRLGVG